MIDTKGNQKLDIIMIIIITSLKTHTANPFKAYIPLQHNMGVFFDFNVGLSGPDLSGTGPFLPDSV